MNPAARRALVDLVVAVLALPVAFGAMGGLLLVCYAIHRLLIWIGAGA